MRSTLWIYAVTTFLAILGSQVLAVSSEAGTLEAAITKIKVHTCLPCKTKIDTMGKETAADEICKKFQLAKECLKQRCQAGEAAIGALNTSCLATNKVPADVNAKLKAVNDTCGILPKVCDSQKEALVANGLQADICSAFGNYVKCVNNTCDDDATLKLDLESAKTICGTTTIVETPTKTNVTTTTVETPTTTNGGTKNLLLTSGLLQVLTFSVKWLV